MLWCMVLKFIIREDNRVIMSQIQQHILTWPHNDYIIMGAMASQITSLLIVYSTLYSDADQRNHQSSASLVFVWGIHWSPVNSPHKWSVTRKMFPFDDLIMWCCQETAWLYSNTAVEWSTQDKIRYHQNSSKIISAYLHKIYLSDDLLYKSKSMHIYEDLLAQVESLKLELSIKFSLCWFTFSSILYKFFEL